MNSAAKSLLVSLCCLPLGARSVTHVNALTAPELRSGTPGGDAQSWDPIGHKMMLDYYLSASNPVSPDVRAVKIFLEKIEKMAST